VRKPLLAIAAATAISPWTLLAATATANPCPAGTPPALCGSGPTMPVVPRQAPTPRAVPSQPPVYHAPAVSSPAARCT